MKSLTSAFFLFSTSQPHLTIKIWLLLYCAQETSGIIYNSCQSLIFVSFFCIHRLRLLYASAHSLLTQGNLKKFSRKQVSESKAKLLLRGLSYLRSANQNPDIKLLAKTFQTSSRFCTCKRVVESSACIKWFRFPPNETQSTIRSPMPPFRPKRKFSIYTSKWMLAVFLAYPKSKKPFANCTSLPNTRNWHSSSLSVSQKASIIKRYK